MVDSIQASQQSSFVTDVAIRHRFEQIADRKAEEAQNVSAPERVDVTRTDRVRESERFGGTADQRNEEAAESRTQGEVARFRELLDERAPESDRLIAVRVGGVSIPDPLEVSEEAVTEAGLRERAIIRRVSAVLAERDDTRARVTQAREEERDERIVAREAAAREERGVAVTEESRPDVSAVRSSRELGEATVRERVVRDARGERVAESGDPEPRLVTQPQVNPPRDGSDSREPFGGELESDELAQVTSVLPGTGAILEPSEAARVPAVVEPSTELRDAERDRAEQRATQAANIEADRTDEAITRFLDGTPAPDPGPQPRPVEVLSERA